MIRYKICIEEVTFNKEKRKEMNLKRWKIEESKHRTCNEFPKSLTFPSHSFDAYLGKFIAVFTSF